MRSGEEGTIAKFTIATFWQRVCIGFIDWVFITFIALVIGTQFEFVAIDRATLMPFIVGWTVVILALAGILSRWGGTPGCFVLQFRVKNSHDRFLTFWWALLRFSPLIVALLLKTLLLHGFLVHLPKDAIFLERSARIELMALYHGNLYVFERIWAQYHWVDLLVILFNSGHRRSAVDLISQAYVVQKSDKESFER